MEIPIRFHRNVDALDRSFDRLREQAAVEERLSLLRQLVEHWHGPIRAGGGFAEAELRGVALPDPLRWWYRLAGRVPGLLDGQNHFLGPRQFVPAGGGRHIFYLENQAVYVWATAAGGDDPPVWGRFNDDDELWTREGMTLSEFLIQPCLFEAILRAPYGASITWAGRPLLQRLISVLSPLPLAAWRWTGEPTCFYGREGAFAFACPNGRYEGQLGYAIWVGARTPRPVGFLKTIVDAEWDSVSMP